VDKKKSVQQSGDGNLQKILDNTAEDGTTLKWE
jgi:hypothetical protein